jgi:prolipoprotein diacylglyceryl transferase
LDALAPGIVFAQAIGRWGNWFNAELFGAPTNLPWALEIPRWARPEGYKDFLTFHPTFLYESLWCALVGFLLIRLSGKLKGGQIFALYIATYCAGRLAFELIRIDEANLIAGIRINVTLCPRIEYTSASVRDTWGDPALKTECLKVTVTPTRILLYGLL